jgi:hypothetical protein
LNPGYIEPPTFYNATSPVQSQYYWGDRPYQPGPTFNEVLYNTAPNAPQTPFGLQQMAEPLTGDQINQIAMGRTVIPNNMRMPVNPYDWSKDYNSNNVPMAPVGVVLPTIQTAGFSVPNRSANTTTTSSTESSPVVVGPVAPGPNPNDPRDTRNPYVPSTTPDPGRYIMGPNGPIYVAPGNEPPGAVFVIGP